MGGMGIMRVMGEMRTIRFFSLHFSLFILFSPLLLEGLGEASLFYCSCTSVAAGSCRVSPSGPTAVTREI